MKRVGNLFEQVCDINNIVKAHENARRGKGFYTEVQMVNDNPGKYLYELQEKMLNGTYKTSEYVKFYKQEGEKLREIYKLPYYPDRIYQWAIIQVIEPYLIRNMTDDTFSAIPGRGTYKAFCKLKDALDKDEENTQWCLKLDVRKYYPNIDKQKLKDKYARLFKDQRLLDMLYEIIDSTDGEKGVPIGNYISQYSGNIYLSDFDHRVKEVYKVKYYYRYMDDMVLLAKTKEELQSLVREITWYLGLEWNLEVKDNWSLFRVDERGIDFIGYVFKHGEIRLRRGIANSLIHTCRQIEKRTEQGRMINYHLYCSINSLKGWAERCTSDGLIRKYVEPIWPYVKQYHDDVIKRKLIIY